MPLSTFWYVCRGTTVFQLIMLGTIFSYSLNPCRYRLPSLRYSSLLATHPVLATGLASLPYRNYKTRTVRNISLSRDNWSCSRVIAGCIAMTWCRSMLTLIVTSSSSQRCFTMARSCRILINVKAIVLSFPWDTRTKTSRRLGGHRAYCFSIRSMTARAAGTLVVASRTNISFGLDSWERCRRKRELDLTHWLCTLR